MIHAGVTTQVLAAAMLMRSPELKPLVDAMRTERLELLEHLATARADQVAQLQGRAQAIGEILRLIDDAETIAGRMGAHKPS